MQLDMFATRPVERDRGAELRDQAKRKLSSENEEWLDRARLVMVGVIKDRGTCSSDDCWRLCPPPSHAHPSVMGCLFDDRRFVRSGDKLSDRPSAHRRRISLYELSDWKDMPWETTSSPP